MGAFSKDLFLPSLLDRLTNEDPINQSLYEVKQKIKLLESELNDLTSVQMDRDELDINKQKEKQHGLRLQLAQMKAQYSTLSASISSKQDIHACVRRDLEWLLNANQYFPNEELSDFPEIARSVLNYGVPDLTGKTVSGMNLAQLERMLFQAIINFEPRIIQKTLTIKGIADQTKMEHNIFVFEIEGELWAKPLPLHLHLRTEFELENSQVIVYDMH